MASHPDAKFRYYALEMIFNIHSDASYLNAPNARNRADGHSPLGSTPQYGCPIRLNVAILNHCTILKMVTASASKAELGALFFNTTEEKIMRLTLEELGYCQLPVPINCDSTTAVGIVNNSIKRQRL